MAELPEVARRRLSRMVGDGNHPDAGLLTALVEGTLAKTHRDDVFNHLVACSECNRLLALIAPEREVTRVVQPAGARRRWVAWPALRWAGAAAVAAVVLSAVVVERIGQHTKVPLAPSAAVEQAPSLATAQLPVPVTAQPSTPRPTNKLSQRASSPRELAGSAAVSAHPPSERVNPAIAVQSRPAVPGNVRGETAFQTSITSSAGSSPDLSSSGVESSPVKAEPPVMTATVPAAPAGPIEPVWSVSAAGVPQRSNDSGHTWVPMAIPSRVPMRDVSVLGQDIWTGGDRGELYHSTDGGHTWTAVVPTSDGVSLSADIMRIVFSDVRHGAIATRDGKIWTTHDGGATWSQK